MKSYLISFSLLVLSLTACTIEQKDGEVQSELRTPLTYAQWKTEQYTTQSGQPVCGVTSGYGGVAVLVRRAQDNTLAVSARVERQLSPGKEFTVNVNGNHYRTREEYFSTREARRLADDFSTEGKAYFELSEPHPDGRSRLRSSNIVRLDGFKQQLEQCRQSLLK